MNDFAKLNDLVVVGNGLICEDKVSIGFNGDISIEIRQSAALQEVNIDIKNTKLHFVQYIIAQSSYHWVPLVDPLVVVG